jgi:hypothetical protein
VDAFVAEGFIVLIGLMFIVAALLALLAANKSLRMRGLSGGRTSMRFILVTLAVFAPMAILLVELNTTAAQNDAVIGPSGGKILMVGGRSSSSILGSTELYDPATDTFAPVDQTASMNAPRFEATATLLTQLVRMLGKFLSQGDWPHRILSRRLPRSSMIQGPTASRPAIRRPR